MATAQHQGTHPPAATPQQSGVPRQAMGGEPQWYASAATGATPAGRMDIPPDAAPQQPYAGSAVPPMAARAGEGPASGLGDVAAALRDAAQRRKLEGDATLGRLADTAADGLERLHGTLGQQDIGAMLRDADAFARRQPAAFFGLALAAGFLAVRMAQTHHD